MRRRLMWPLAVTGAIGIVGGMAWLYRTPLVTGFVDRQLKARGVDARYSIEQIGFRTQRLSNVSIGDPHRPDLTAREVIIDITIGISGPTITRIEANGVRLKGRWTGDRLTLGQLDRLKPADDGSPFELPDMQLALSDASARIDSPWGVTGVALTGKGHLRDGFAGVLALRAPRLEAGGCELRSVGGQLALSVTDRTPKLQGPLGLDALNCRGTGVRMADVRIGLKASMREDMQRWSVESGVRSGALIAGPVRGAAITGRVTAERGEGGRTSGQWQLAGRDATSPWLNAGSLAVEGEGALAGDGSMIATGRIGLVRGRAGQQAMRQFASLAAWDESTPVGPLVAKAGQSLAGAGRQLTLSGQYEVQRGRDRQMRASFGDVAVSSASGASLRLDGERALGWDSGRGLSIATQARIGGGGLPQGTVQLARGGDGSPLTGEARFAPYQAGTAVLAMAPLRFTALSDGSARFATGIALTGPLAGGRLDRLSLPLAGRVERDGTLAISGECRTLAWHSLSSGSIALDRGGMRLCGQGGAPLLSFGPRGLRGGALLPPLRLTGRTGDSPLQLASSGGSLTLVNQGFELRGVEALIGEGDSLTRFAAARIVGAAGSTGLAGSLINAEAKIGPVPLLMSNINGGWQWTGGALNLNGALRLTDAAAEARFLPMISDTVTLNLRDGQISAEGGLKEEHGGTPVADVVIRHDLSRGAGDARFALSSLRFAVDGLQPRDLSPLALGVIANADGLVTGQGAIDWDATGVRSTGDFSTERLDFAAAFGPVQRLSGRLHFNDLLNLSTPPHQEVLLGSVNPGIEVTDGRLLYQLTPGQKVRIEGGRWPFAGGELRLQPAWLDFGAEVPRHLTFDVSNVDAALFLQRFEFENITATGIFDGVLPTVFDQDGGRVDGGRLVSRSGGSLAYVGELSNRDLGTYANLAFGALKSLRFDSLAISLNGAIDGEMLTQVDFAGLSQGQGASRNILTRAVEQLPFAFSIRINAPFRQLLSSARGLYDPTSLIEQNLPALVQAERAAEARAAAARAGGPGASATPLPNPAPLPQSPGEARLPAVQPRESEDRP